MRLVRSADSRRTETPAAVMTTLASPAQGGAAQPIWRVEAAAGVPGPVHCVDTAQVWTVVGGAVTVIVEGEGADLAAGDTVVVPADAARRFTPGPEGFTAVVTGPAGMRAYLPGAATAKQAPPWTV